MNPIIGLGTNIDPLSSKTEDSDKELKSELNNELMSMDFFGLLNAYFNMQPAQLQQKDPPLLQNKEKIELNKNENILVNDAKNEKIMSLINQINALENLDSVVLPQDKIEIPNQEKKIINTDIKNDKIINLINNINNKIPDKLEIFQNLDKYFKQENKPIYDNNVETIVEKLQKQFLPEIELKEDEFPLLQKNLVINKSKSGDFNSLLIPISVSVDRDVNMPENNKKNEIILAELKSLPILEQRKIIQSFMFEKNENINNPKLNFIFPEIKNNFDKKTEIILTELKSLPHNEQIKILQSLVVSKIENQNIPILVREASEFSVVNNQDPMKKFMDTAQDDNKDEDRKESTLIFGNNGEKIVHSEVKHSNMNHENILPTKDLASTTIAKAMDLVDQLKATQGGTAKFQIQDPQLGKIDLKIEMKNMNSITVSIQTEHTDIKKNMEDKVDSLKQSLEGQKITLTDFKVTIIDKPSNTQMQFSNSSHQEQQNGYQNLQFQNNFNQNSKNENHNLVQDEMNINNNYKKVQKNTITNIQRGANGSIKVLA